MIVKFFFFSFSRNADLVLDLRIVNRNEMPGLKIGAARRASGNAQAIFNNFTRNRAFGKFTHRSSLLHLRFKFGRASP